MYLLFVPGWQQEIIPAARQNQLTTRRAFYPAQP
jgi:hypothetical protein